MFIYRFVRKATQSLKRSFVGMDPSKSDEIVSFLPEVHAWYDNIEQISSNSKIWKLFKVELCNPFVPVAAKNGLIIVVIYISPK